MKHTLSYRFGHPNPQFFRENYKVLNGEWDFVFDFLDEGIDKEYNKNFPTDCLKINVPFPYQAKSSLIGQDKTHCDVVWYRKKIILDNNSSHYKLTFFGVDYITFVYVNGIKVVTFAYEDSVNFTNDIGSIKKLSNERVALLNDYSKEEVSEFVSNIKKRINEVYVNKGASIGINLDPIFVD